MSNGEERPGNYAAEVYRAYRETWRVSMELVGAYGKWLIAQLTLIHAGAIYVLASSEHFRPVLGSGAIWWFVIGLMLSLFCGLATWFNWSLNANAAKVYFDPSILEDGAEWPELSRGLSLGITGTYWLSLALGLASALCIPLGAWYVSSAMGSPA